MTRHAAPALPHATPAGRSFRGRRSAAPHVPRKSASDYRTPQQCATRGTRVETESCWATSTAAVSSGAPSGWRCASPGASIPAGRFACLDPPTGFPGRWTTASRPTPLRGWARQARPHCRMRHRPLQPRARRRRVGAQRKSGPRRCDQHQRGPSTGERASDAFRQTIRGTRQSFAPRSQPKGAAHAD